jgi:signal peptidase I
VRRRRSWNWLIYPAAVLGFLLLASITLAPSILHSYNTPSGSMRPNLQVGDYFFAWRGDYASRPPERGEIALFLHKDTTWVKRVIGLPGDTIEMKAGRLWINGAEVDRQEDGTESDAEFGRVFKRYRETLPNGVRYGILEKDDTSQFDEVAPFHVPADSYFVMGDNRDNSNDSRVPAFGTVTGDKFTDRPFLIYFSRTMGRIGTRIN